MERPPGTRGGTESVDPALPLLGEVTEVVIVASSSRGGSSLLADILRHVPGLLHFEGEINPFLVSCGLAFPASGSGSDLLGAEHADDGPAVRELARLLAEDCVVSASGQEDSLLALPPEVRSRFLDRLIWRLGAQWPALQIQPGEIAEALASAEAGLQSPRDVAELHLRLLLSLRRRHPKIDPYYYDIPPEQIRQAAPEIPLPEGPPGDRVVEEPPFILIAPCRAPSAHERATMPLVIKTPSNSFRLEFLRVLFPRARFRVLHLTRSAAASVNGLVDGWRHHGFFSHCFPGRLAIPGYTDEQGPWAASWWKFDLPPGWEDYTNRPLIDVCAFQWRAAHEAALAFLESKDVQSHRLHFEDVLDPATRSRALSEMAAWLGVELSAEAAGAQFSKLPVLMATERPRQSRWLDRADLLRPMLESRAIRETMEKLGYDERPSTWL